MLTSAIQSTETDVNIRNGQLNWKIKWVLKLNMDLWIKVIQTLIYASITYIANNNIQVH